MTYLTSQQAYLAMFAFLECQYETTGSDDIGALLGALGLLSDGIPVDAAHVSEWNIAVAAALAGDVNASFGAKK